MIEIGDLIVTFKTLQKLELYNEINGMFKKFLMAPWYFRQNVDETPLMIITFLRSNYMVRDEIEDYYEVLLQSIIFFEEVGKDPKKYLHGLI